MEAGRFAFCVLLIIGYAYCYSSRADEAIIEDLRSAPGSRIVAGKPAADGQIPYQISLRAVSREGQVISCGGSIIHNQWILTAAHCVAYRFSFVVRLGLTNLTRPDYIVESTRKFIHPNYIEWRPFVQTHDIALVGLHDPIPYTDYIQPVRLGNSGSKWETYEDVRMIVSGYGRTDDEVNGGAASEILLYTFQLGITNERCLTFYPGSPVIREQTICALSYNDTAQSSCQGDSGGPLTFVDADGQATQIGVVSFVHGSGCNGPYPAGYVRPSWYHDWFLQVTGIDFDWNQEDIKAKLSIPDSPETSQDNQGRVQVLEPVVLMKH